jgi:hypothetical protein
LKTVKIIKGFTVTNSKLEGGNLMGFRQGNLDGACGSHAAMTAMVAVGAIDQKQAMTAWNDVPDGRTKLAKALKDKKPLFQDGTNCEEIITLINAVEHYVKGINTLKPYAHNNKESFKKKNEVIGQNFLKVVVEKIKLGVPSILWLDWNGGGAHWSVAIGYETDERNILNIIMIDPGAEMSRIQLWNAVLTYRSARIGGAYRNRYFVAHDGSRDSVCTVSNAVILY